MIEARDLGIRVGRHVLLHAITLRLPPGTLTAVLGPNGAGKTTLLRAMNGELAAQFGRVLFENTPIAQWTPAALARRRAVLSQHQALAFGLTVEDVVSLGRLPHRGTAAARQDRAALIAVRREFDLGTLWQRRYPSLSGGERQRAQLARAAAQLWRPDGDQTGQALFLDEPAAALDLAQQRLALRFAVATAARGAAVMAVLHDPNHAVDADRVIMLKNGETVACGATRDVLTASNLTQCLGITVETMIRGDGRPVFVV